MESGSHLRVEHKATDESTLHAVVVASLGPHVVTEAAKHHEHHYHHTAKVEPHGDGHRDADASSLTGTLASGAFGESVTASMPASGAAGVLAANAKLPPQHVPFDLSEMLKAKKTDAELKGMKKALREFYEQQNELIEFYEEVEENRAEEAMQAEAQLKKAALKKLEEERNKAAESQSPSGAGAGTEASSTAVAVEESAKSPAAQARAAAKAVEDARVEKLVNLALNLSFAANVFLLAIKVYAAVSSNSLAVIASTVDSVMDLVSGAVVWLAS